MFDGYITEVDLKEQEEQEKINKEIKARKINNYLFFRFAFVFGIACSTLLFLATITSLNNSDDHDLKIMVGTLIFFTLITIISLVKIIKYEK